MTALIFILSALLFLVPTGLFLNRFRDAKGNLKSAFALIVIAAILLGLGLGYLINTYVV